MPFIAVLAVDEHPQAAGPDETRHVRAVRYCLPDVRRTAVHPCRVRERVAGQRINILGEGPRLGIVPLIPAKNLAVDVVRPRVGGIEWHPFLTPFAVSNQGSVSVSVMRVYRDPFPAIYFGCPCLRRRLAGEDFVGQEAFC